MPVARASQVAICYAVLSDIHGNAAALRAIIDDAQRRGITRFINLGDIVYGPLWPAQTRRLLEAIAPITIQGNQDREIYQAGPAQIAASPTLRHVIGELGDDGLAWLRALPSGLQFEAGGRAIRLTHGTPADDCIYLLEDVADGTPQLRADAAIQALLPAGPETLVLCGHSHIPRCVSLVDGRRLVNPGSVGLPAYDDELPLYHRMQTYSPMASYAIIEITDSGIDVELPRIAYDYRAAAQQARKLDRADWAGWIETGRTAPIHPA